MRQNAIAPVLKSRKEGSGTALSTTTCKVGRKQRGNTKPGGGAKLRQRVNTRGGRRKKVQAKDIAKGHGGRKKKRKERVDEYCRKNS